VGKVFIKTKNGCSG